jgi:segregation and condensation protein B
MQDPIEPSIHQQAIDVIDTNAPRVKRSSSEETSVDGTLDVDTPVRATSDDETADQGRVDADSADENTAEKEFLVRDIVDKTPKDEADSNAGIVGAEAIMPVAQLQKIIESALMAYSQPLTIEKLQTLFTGDHLLESGVATVVPEKNDILTALAAISASCRDRGFELKKVSSGWRFQVQAEMAPWINKLWEEKPQRYSRALLETLSIIAYRQPITRGDIEEVRGVAVSSHIIKTLSEREWVKVIGHRDVPGRPALFATTRQFLDYFNLENLEDLPSLRELADIGSLTPELDFKSSKASAVNDAIDVDDPKNLALDLALDDKLEIHVDDNENLLERDKIVADTQQDMGVPEKVESFNADSSADQTLHTDLPIDNLPPQNY